ncbi:DUF937 domain-containing protein [Caenimonas koreensis DSM 17982]|uniref:DUF937 domain-containing protein n=1 Tax=Caenimonas koreensis DSM 17982 TaxID=1121255 RepID=A0A844AQH6_9BURK|nr:YidB family protein [Caenimonas koreensis]MRD46520.1 DUF937 domain-containing protein [Caenimonas koreensis DSM 17982]
MSTPALGEVLASTFANAMAERPHSHSFHSPDVGIGSLSMLVGGLMGRGAPMDRGHTLGRDRGLLLAMLLPFAMRWIQRNGGVRGVLESFRQRGYGAQALSWLSTGANTPLQAEAIDSVVDHEDVSVLARQLGVQETEVSSGLAEILPEVVNQLSPAGAIASEADEALDAGVHTLEKELNEIQTGMTT